MIRLFFPLLLFGSVSVTAEIYKWVDAEGHTYFSDRPQSDTESMEVIAPRPQIARENVTPAASPETALLGPYLAFDIVSPEANQTLKTDQGQLPISLILDPALQNGHRLALELDGGSITPNESAGTQLLLTGVPHGTHRALAQILDHQGQLIARTRTIHFHLRKPTPPGVLE
jgi:hypothetical protein